MIINVGTEGGGYCITIERNSVGRADKYFNLDRKALILTDEGVPPEYSRSVADCCREPYTVSVKQGEESKSLGVFGDVLEYMLDKGFTRNDCVVAVGGGVCGDLAGFCASCYMRGIDFYNVPTTLLAQVDSSVGGKTAVNMRGVKNIVGAFWQPKAVLIDAETLKTLERRQISNGLAEAVKSGLIADAGLFELFEKGIAESDVETVISRSLEVKRKTVERDEREKGLRKLLNFGHTLGHGIESAAALSGLLHGECVAVGMLPMCGADIKERVKKVLESLNLPTKAEVDFDRAYEAILHDKKRNAEGFDIVTVNEIGKGRTVNVSEKYIYEKLGEAIV